MLVKVLKNIVSYSTVIVAIGYLIFSVFYTENSLYDNMILSLLILIATTFVLENIDEKRKWRKVEKNIAENISSITGCQILTFTNTKDWVNKMIELTKDGNHTFDSAALDKTTRSKAKVQYLSIWEYLNKCSREERIVFRHILRIRQNNFKNLLDRIVSGNAKKNSYFAYYELPSNFSFPTFGIIDERYIATRSPYQQGELPCYMIIDNALIAKFFVNYFNDLWKESHKVENVIILKEFLVKFGHEYSPELKEYCQKMIDKIEKEGIIDDI